MCLCPKISRSVFSVQFCEAKFTRFKKCIKNEVDFKFDSVHTKCVHLTRTSHAEIPIFLNAFKTFPHNLFNRQKYQKKSFDIENFLSGI